MIVLIPSYEPDQRLVDLVGSLVAAGQRIVVVDDGSGPTYSSVFDAVRDLGCDVVTHDVNRGKGVALKTGFARIAAHHPGHDVVCADCDGQHTLIDIVRVGEHLAGHRTGVVLGARQFVGDVPARSRFGNSMTRSVFAALTGLRVQDTQTGLRGCPAWLLGWLQGIDGDRFEYELEVLLAARREGFEIHEVPIATIYLEGNESSHFHPIRDSIRVYVPLLRFACSSITAFAVDTIVFLTLFALTDRLLLSVVAARVVSAALNFTMNGRWVFRRSGRSTRSTALRYGALVLAVLGANYLMLHGLLTVLGVPVVVAKLVTEATLFLASYQVQRRLVFRSQPTLSVATGDRQAETVGSSS